ncbi:MAG: ATP-binding region ATPase domain protein [Dactylosporangium sp.]|jgi:serine/threonine-protein kinase RsbW|nr:ATP-binding region ATPase domain protein [Dactylosporangium sp.]
MTDDTQTSSRPPALLSELFDHQLITTMRHAVTRLAARAGLAGQRLDDFVLAVNEMMTNAVRHAGGSGVLILWCQDETLQCEVVDKGPGIPSERIDGQPLPPPFALNGRGLWLAHRLCDSVTIKTGPRGTTVRLAIGLAC